MITIIRSAKNIVRKGLNPYIQYRITRFSRKNSDTSLSSKIGEFPQNVVGYIESMNLGDPYAYRFAASQSEEDLYSSVYALMTYGLLGQIKILSSNEQSSWAEYICSYQCEDGLFRDPYLQSPQCETIDYWGWRHLVPHIIIALDYLGVTPKHDFEFIYLQFKSKSIEDWIRSLPWSVDYLAVSNTLMNYGVLLQYSRDRFGNRHAEELIARMKAFLVENFRDPCTELWGFDTSTSAFNLSKAIKTAYHILPFYIYDEEFEGFDRSTIVEYALMTQNRMGGFSPFLDSDACEDMDSVYLLANIHVASEELDKKVCLSLERFLNWVFINFNTDGGAVFRRDTCFQYADQKRLSSLKNESNMFATWFRALSIAYALSRLRRMEFEFSACSGYQYRYEAE